MRLTIEDPEFFNDNVDLDIDLNDDDDAYARAEDVYGLPPYYDYHEEEDYYDFPESWEEGPWYDPQDGDYL